MKITISKQLTSDLLHKLAFDPNNNVVHLEDARKGGIYYCPECGDPFVIKDSGKTGKGSKRKHFSHPGGSDRACDPETILHRLFKKAVVQLLNSHIGKSKPYPIAWSCAQCSKEYHANLLSNIAVVKEEYNMKERTPDVALLDKNNNVITVLEVVVTHAPEEGAREFYRNQGVVLIQINLDSEEDLNQVAERVAVPDLVEFCSKEHCQYSSKYHGRVRLSAYQEACKVCFQPVTKCYKGIITSFGEVRSYDFTMEEIEHLRQNKIILQMRTNSETNKMYPTFECISCRRRKMRHSRRPL